MKGNVVTRITAVVAAAAIAVTGISASGVTAKADVLHPSEATARGFKLVGKNVHVGEFGDYMIDIPDNWVPWEDESMVFYGYTDCVKLGYWIAKNDPSQSDDSLVYFGTEDKSHSGNNDERDKFWCEASRESLKKRILTDASRGANIPEQIAEQYIYLSDLRQNPAGINYYYGEFRVPAEIASQYSSFDGIDKSIYAKYYLYDGEKDCVYIRQQGRYTAQNPDFDSMALSLRPYVEPASEKPKMKLYSKKGAKSIKQIFAIVKKSRSRKEQKKHPDWTLDEYLIGKKVYGKVYKINDEDGEVTIKDRKTKQKIIISTNRFEDMEVGKSYVFKIDSAFDQSRNCIHCSEPYR